MPMKTTPKTTQKTKTHTARAGRADPKVTKASTKKQKQRSKATKARIEKLNKDSNSIDIIHQELLKQPQKETHPLDAASLQDGLEKDKKMRQQSAKAEQDLESQLELMTGFSL